MVDYSGFIKEVVESGRRLPPALKGQPHDCDYCHEEIPLGSTAVLFVTDAVRRKNHDSTYRQGHRFHPECVSERMRQAWADDTVDYDFSYRLREGVFGLGK